MDALIVVAKKPAPGRTKTRLVPPLTPRAAADLYEALLCDTLDIARSVPGVRPMIAFLPEGAEGYFRRLAPEFDLMLQEGRDLGERLDNALTRCLSDGFRRAVIMDSDSPTLPVRTLEQAFESLDASDVVIGPCDDGGYYLIGLKRPAPRLLRQVRMSTSQVLRDTLELAAAEGLSVTQLPPWYDVDDASGLERLRRELRAIPSGRASHTRGALSLQHPQPQGSSTK